MDRVDSRALQDVLEHAVAIVSRYNGKELIFALAVGFAIQITALLAFRLIGITIRVFIRFLAWVLGVATALYLLDHNVRIPVDWDQIVGWLGFALDIVRHSSNGT